jgi:spore maturation protein CgeB
MERRPPSNIVLFCHSLESDWNHGNAHFLRGVCRALQERGHRVTAYEPRDGWSRTHLLAEHGEAEIEAFRSVYPDLTSHLYDLETLDLDRVLDGADLVLVHEWNLPELVRRLGEHRQRCRRHGQHGSQAGYHLLFHDTHHRSVTEPASLAAYDLAGYDGVLAFGAAVREKYLKRGWAERVWVWHEAADVTVFKPLPAISRLASKADLVWIGNWGDDERTAELHEFFLEPVRELGLVADAYGVRYPQEALEALREAGVRYRGWLPNYRVPEEFARHRFTIHVPRRPYVEKLPGIPTIRVFEALACGIPLVTAPWRDSEGLFQAGRDYLVARNGEEMRRSMRALVEDAALGAELAAHGRATILARHTCGHRADELLAIHSELTAQAGRNGDRREVAS